MDPKPLASGAETSRFARWGDRKDQEKSKNRNVRALRRGRTQVRIWRDVVAAHSIGLGIAARKRTGGGKKTCRVAKLVSYMWGSKEGGKGLGVRSPNCPAERSRCRRGGTGGSEQNRHGWNFRTAVAFKRDFLLSRQGEQKGERGTPNFFGRAQLSICPRNRCIHRILSNCRVMKIKGQLKARGLIREDSVNKAKRTG